MNFNITRNLISNRNEVEYIFGFLFLFCIIAAIKNFKILLKNLYICNFLRQDKDFAN